MTCNQMLSALYFGDPASPFNRAHIVPENTLTTTSLHEGAPFSLPNSFIGDDGVLHSSLPFLDVSFRCRRITFDPARLVSNIGYSGNFIANQPNRADARPRRLWLDRRFAGRYRPESTGIPDREL